ncbi:F0F1-type ATP synthase assembly protein I [Pedobacter sp. UYP24]
MEEKNKQGTNFAKYSSISFQMLATIGVFTFAGYKLDAYRQSKSPIFTALLGLLGVVISLYQVVRQLNKKE